MKLIAKRRATAVMLTAVLTCAGRASAASPVTPTLVANRIAAGDLVVYQVGTGSGSLGSAAAQVYLDDYSTTGTLQQQVQILGTSPGQPGSVAANTQYALTDSGTGTSDGKLALSSDGSTIVFTGYNADVGTASVVSTASTTNSRTVGLLSVAGGAVDTSTSLTNVDSGNNVRSAASPDGNAIYTAGSSGGVYYATKGATSATNIVSDTANAVVINNGTLYMANTSAANGIYQVGSTGALPTTKVANPSSGGAGGTNAPAVAIDTKQGTITSNPSSFIFATLGATTAGVPSGQSPDTIYLADVSASGKGYGEIQKYSYDPSTATTPATTYQLTGDLVISGLTGLTGVTQTVNGTAQEVLYATTAGTTTTAPTVVEVTDASGFNGSLGSMVGGTNTYTETTLITGSVDTSFDGVVDVAATPEPASLALLSIGIVPLVARRRRRRL